MKGFDMPTAAFVVSRNCTDWAFNDSGCTAFAVAAGEPSESPPM
ncbi:hypothetical protein HMPREF9153_0411 [Cutibacterium avidum ATCC 25577]|uniref:Uncharacterized protein n=2 Tax=root TaxID=1 RepID=G4CV54_9ACTN|nr:hypothetical protein HMPREF9153_0411 [Cutibacterium avidum ATCC 25577]